MGDPIVLGEVDITGDPYAEERRRRRRRVAAPELAPDPNDPLASLGSDVAGATEGILEEARTRALASLAQPPSPQAPAPAPAPARAPGAPLPAVPAPGVAPPINARAAAERAVMNSAPAAPATPRASDPGVNEMGVRGVYGPPPPRTAPAPDAPPGGKGGTPGNEQPIRGASSQVDTELNAALAERNRRQTGGNVIDGLALLLGGGGSAVTAQIGQNPNATQPLEDLRLRRGERERQSTAASAEADRQRAARMADPNSPESRAAVQTVVNLGIVADPRMLEGLSANDISSFRTLYAAQQRNVHSTAATENAQQFTAQQNEAERALRLQVAQLQRHRGGGGGGAGSGARRAAQVEALVSAAAARGEDADAARALVSTLSPRALEQRAAGLVGAVTSGNGDQAAERANLTRISQYHARLDSVGVTAAEAALDEVEASLEGLRDSDIQQAIAAMNAGEGRAESALALLTEANPRAGRFAQAVSGLQNAQLRLQSGAAVSGQEFTRYRTGLGSGSMISAAPIRNGLQVVRRAVQRDRQNVDAGYPDVVEWERTGSRPTTTPRLGGPRGQGAPAAALPAGTVLVRARNGRVYPVPEANVAAALADGGVRVNG